jgi:uncharacterized membrane protein
MTQPTARPRRRIVRRGLGLTGYVVAVAFFCLSLTPSLLPRSPVLQGVVSGLTAAIGYALGATVAALVLAAARRRPPARVTRVTWRVLFVVAPLVCLLFLALGTRWQQELRARLGMERLATYDILRIIGVAVLTFAVLLLVARFLRWSTGALARLLGRVVPKPIAYGAGVLVVVYLFVGFVQNFLWSGVVDFVGDAASLTNGTTEAGVTAPLAPSRSGSPESAVRWKDLGKQGRTFVATSPGRAEIERFAGRPALDPIRVYVGLDSAPTAQARAALAVQELERTGAFDREALAVVTATGTGWVDANVTDSLEYMYAGDTALVSMQYSYLPSWLSFLVDQSKVTETATALIGAVQQRLATMPADQRPKLLLFGESLGSYGTETSQGNLAALSGGADGTLLVGPPFANPIWRDLVAGRESGTPVWRPVVDGGGTVRFARAATDLRAGPAGAPKLVYLQNSSDPIVWWSPSLLVEPPEWLDDPRGPDVSPEMRWYPGVTFWQTLVDQFFANGVPAGHGHVYGSGVVDGWAALQPPDGWTTADTERLRALLDTRP